MASKTRRYKGTEKAKRDFEVATSLKKKLFRVGESDVSAQADHANARGDALAAAESVAVLEFLFERSGGQHHEEVCGRVEDYRDCAEDYELREDVAGLRGNKLRNEG